jgi:hypothetical protein
MSSVVSGRQRTRGPAEPRTITPALRANTRQNPTAANGGPSAAGTPASRRLARRRPAAVALATLMRSTHAPARNPRP